MARQLSNPAFALLLAIAFGCGGDDPTRTADLPPEAGDPAQADLAGPDDVANEATAAADDGLTAPDDGLTAADEGLTAADEGIATPDEATATPDDGIAGPDEGIAPPDEGISPECEAGPAVCEGNDVVTCVDQRLQHAPCGDDAYCNFGACQASTIHLPRDAGFHTERSEWWYYTGHLQDGEHTWGFEVTIFQYDLAAVFDDAGYGYMCHVAVTDKKAGEHYHVDTIAMEPGVWTAAPLVLEVDNCHFELGGDGRDHITGIIPAGEEKDGKASPWRIDLAVEPRKRPAFHGADGIIPMSAAGGTSWYYSYTRLAATGTLSTPEGDHAVEGQAWMDHQWGQFDIVDFKGWDWWSLQFEDGHEIMLFQFTDWDGNLASQAGTVVDPKGNLTALEGLDAFSIQSLRTWASTKTDGIYPLDWDITIPEGNWSLAVRTSVDDQEVRNIAQNYWEGETIVSGTRAGSALSGVGYTELTGYATDFLDPPRE